jgi:hypothetical protein
MQRVELLDDGPDEPKSMSGHIAVFSTTCTKAAEVETIWRYSTLSAIKKVVRDVDILAASIAQVTNFLLVVLFVLFNPTVGCLPIIAFRAVSSTLLLD